MAQIFLSDSLAVTRCPHCAAAQPAMNLFHRFETTDHTGSGRRFWAIYACRKCGGVVSAASPNSVAGVVTECYPSSRDAHDDIPERPRAYLQQAMESLHAPSGAVLLCASAVDSMLKLRGLTTGSLYARIEAAAAQHLITADMAQWAHRVRLDANDERHADELASLPTIHDATRSIKFTEALAEILFVLPKQVERGLDEPPA